MKVYVFSLLSGFLVGAIYALLGIRSPAPPVVALVGLLGMLLGEQAVPILKRLTSEQPLTRAFVSTECVPKITGVPKAPEGERSAPNAVGPSSSTSSGEK